jgi:nucleoside-diphosphate-sugar epimerase
MSSLSLTTALRGKNILLTGVTGFVGKVWLCMLLARLPDVGKIYVLLRGKSKQTGLQRMEGIVNRSPVFKVLHEKYGEGLEAFLRKHLEVIEGDISEPNFGLTPERVSSLTGVIHVIVNVAGFVSFRPDLRKAFRANVQGGLHALELARTFKCPLLHVSTAFVAGSRDGLIEESATPDYAPKDIPFDAAQEYAELENLVGASAASSFNWEQEGQSRAESKGWPNAYAYTKSLTESLLFQRARGVPVSVFRPTIIESSLEFPFPGWNEGITTCAPLSYLLSRWTRLVPINPGQYLDLVPVDTVCEQMTVVVAALLEGKEYPVYHCGTSDKNPLNLRFAVELMGLSQRDYLKKNGKSFFEKKVLARMEPVVVRENGFFTATTLKKLTTILMDIADLASPHVSDNMRRGLEVGRKSLHKIKWDLAKAELVLETFRPYLFLYQYRFITRNLSSHAVEEMKFRFYPEKLSWSEYIVFIHEPGLRKWCYPLMQGGRPEEYQPTHSCSLGSVA